MANNCLFDSHKCCAYANDNSNISLWHHVAFNSVRSQFDHESDVITNPPQLGEGCIACPKCLGTKTINYQLQCKHADESSTTFVRCMNPKCMKVTRMCN